MKNLLLILGAFVLSSSVGATTLENNAISHNVFGYNNSVIFVEGGITFSVFPDGEFDFYIDNRVNFGANLNFGRNNITFNTGFDYNPFVQYDDYGAVIQIENVPVFYDYYGRVSQIGGINIWYNNGRLRRVGGLYVYYNNRGLFSRFNGFINVYNRNYIYSPFHTYFARPALGFCLVYNRPYRRFYTPVRYTFYRPYVNNARRYYARVGHTYRYNHRPERERLYRNDRRVAVRDNRGRRDSGYIRDNGELRDSRKGGRSSNATPMARTTSRTESVRTVRNTDKARMNERSNTRSVITRNSAPVNTKRNDSRVAGMRSEGRTESRSVAKRNEVHRSTGSKSMKRSAPATERNKVASRTPVSRKGEKARSGRDVKSRSASGTTTTRSRRVQ